MGDPLPGGDDEEEKEAQVALPGVGGVGVLGGVGPDGGLLMRNCFKPA